MYLFVCLLGTVTTTRLHLIIGEMIILIRSQDYNITMMLHLQSHWIRWYVHRGKLQTFRHFIRTVLCTTTITLQLYGMREQLIVMTLIKMSISYKYRCGKIGRLYTLLLCRHKKLYDYLLLLQEIIFVSLRSRVTCLI